MKNHSNIFGIEFIKMTVTVVSVIPILLQNTIFLYASSGEVQYLAPPSMWQSDGDADTGSYVTVVFDGLPMHLPYNIWKMFEAELVARLNKDDPLIKRIVDERKGLGRVEAGRAVIEDEALDVLLDVLNKEWNKTGRNKLKREDIEEYVWYHSQTHFIVRNRWMSLVSSLTRKIHSDFEDGKKGDDASGVEETFRLAGEVFQAELLGSIKSNHRFEEFKKVFSNNYGYRDLGDTDFVEKLLVCYIADSDMFKKRVDVMQDKDNRRRLVGIDQYLSKKTIAYLDNARILINIDRIRYLRDKLMRREASAVEERIFFKCIEVIRKKIKDDRIPEANRLHVSLEMDEVLYHIRPDEGILKRAVGKFERFERLFAGGKYKFKQTDVEEWINIYLGYLANLRIAGLHDESKRLIASFEKVFMPLSSKCKMPDKYYIVIYYFKALQLFYEVVLNQEEEKLDEVKNYLLLWKEYVERTGYQSERSLNDTLYYLGWIYYLENDYKRAAESVEKVRNDNVSFFVNICNVFMALREKDYDRAEAGLKEIFSSDLETQSLPVFVLISRGIADLNDVSDRRRIIEQCPKNNIAILFSLMVAKMEVSDVVELMPLPKKPQTETERVAARLVFIDFQLDNKETSSLAEREKQEAEEARIASFFQLALYPAKKLLGYAEKILSETDEDVIIELLQARLRLETEVMKAMFELRVLQVKEEFCGGIKREYDFLDNAVLDKIWDLYVKGTFKKITFPRRLKRICAKTDGFIKEFKKLSGMELNGDRRTRFINQIALLVIGEKPKDAAEIYRTQFSEYARTELKDIFSQYGYGWDPEKTWRINVFLGISKSNFCKRLAEKHKELSSETVNKMWEACTGGSITEDSIDGFLAEIRTATDGFAKEFGGLSGHDINRQKKNNLVNKILTAYVRSEREKDMICEEEFSVCAKEMLSEVIVLSGYEWNNTSTWKQNVSSFVDIVTGLFSKTKGNIERRFAECEGNIGAVDAEDMKQIRVLLDNIKVFARIAKRDTTDAEERHRRIVALFNFVKNIVKSELIEIKRESGLDDRIEKCKTLLVSIERSGHAEYLKSYVDEIEKIKEEAEKARTGQLGDAWAKAKTMIRELGLDPNDFDREEALVFYKNGEDRFYEYLLFINERKVRIEEYELEEGDLDKTELAGFTENLDESGMKEYLTSCARNKYSAVMEEIKKQIEGLHEDIKRNKFSPGNMDPIRERIGEYKERFDNVGLDIGELLSGLKSVVKINEIIGILRDRLTEIERSDPIFYTRAAECLAGETIDSVTVKIVHERKLGQNFMGKLLHTDNMVTINDAGKFNDMMQLAQFAALHMKRTRCLIINKIAENKPNQLFAALVEKFTTKSEWHRMSVSVNGVPFGMWNDLCALSYKYQTKETIDRIQDGIAHVVAQQGKKAGLLKKTLDHAELDRAVYKAGDNEIHVWVPNNDDVLYIKVIGKEDDVSVEAKKIKYGKFITDIEKIMQEEQERLVRELETAV